MNKIRTLIVDDEPISQKHLTSILHQYCPDLQVVDVASDAGEALEKILIEKPALVFLDIELGGESGFDVLKKCTTKNFEVIFVTAHNQFGIDAVKAHAFDYILNQLTKLNYYYRLKMSYS
ncbi:MAG TPA: response regulator [Chitinophagaceae bacterium]|nr:response regulator [Chitinophagaceae bacterium]